MTQLLRSYKQFHYTALKRMSYEYVIKLTFFIDTVIISAVRDISQLGYPIMHCIVHMIIVSHFIQSLSLIAQTYICSNGTLIGYTFDPTHCLHKANDVDSDCSIREYY